jgi:hypothetical protein
MARLVSLGASFFAKLVSPIPTMAAASRSMPAVYIFSRMREGIRRPRVARVSTTFATFIEEDEAQP